MSFEGLRFLSPSVARNIGLTSIADLVKGIWKPDTQAKEELSTQLQKSPEQIVSVARWLNNRFVNPPPQRTLQVKADPSLLAIIHDGIDTFKKNIIQASLPTPPDWYFRMVIALCAHESSWFAGILGPNLEDVGVFQFHEKTAIDYFGKDRINQKSIEKYFLRHFIRAKEWKKVCERAKENGLVEEKKLNELDDLRKKSSDKAFLMNHRVRSIIASYLHENQATLADLESIDARFDRKESTAMFFKKQQNILAQITSWKNQLWGAMKEAWGETIASDMLWWALLHAHKTGPEGIIWPLKKLVHHHKKIPDDQKDSSWSLYQYFNHKFVWQKNQDYPFKLLQQAVTITHLAGRDIDKPLGDVKLREKTLANFFWSVLLGLLVGAITPWSEQEKTQAVTYEQRWWSSSPTLTTMWRRKFVFWTWAALVSYLLPANTSTIDYPYW